MSNLRIAYVINDASFFISHRLPLALKVIEMGGKVCLITGTNINKDIEEKSILTLKKNKISLHRCKFSQGVNNPISELIGLFQLINYLRKFKPTTVHSVTAKANLMTSIACNFFKHKKLIISISGMGTLFTGKLGVKKLIFQKIFTFLLRRALKRIKFKFIFQNKEDYYNYKSIIHIDENQFKIINGSGVDTFKLKPMAKKSNVLKVLLPARMLFEKGIEEFVNASKILKEKKIEGEFYLAGDTVSLNPSAIDKMKIDCWVKKGLVIYLGHIIDLHKMYSDIDIVCLPSWREGFPKVLMEAASFGIPIITTDVPGCRDAVINNKTGIIVPVRNEIKLADAITKLFKNKSLRKKMGKENRNIARKNFDLSVIVPKVVNLYE
ncbi:MAG: hypothetical protein CMP38_01145 [Rickettsiales bacterium]|nr:hypothetical protein [Rickettsiales bacterium]